MIGPLIQKISVKPSPYMEVVPLLPANIRRLVLSLSEKMLANLEEIRLRKGKPLCIGVGEKYYFISPEGKTMADPERAYAVTAEDVDRTVQSFSGSSIYALEEELRNGFITLPGGHRVGLVGSSVVEEGRLRTVKNISALNVRISREAQGVALPLLPYITNKMTGTIYHTLIFSPPRCGKTTLLRDIIRLVSDGVPSVGLQGVTVGVIDERSELAGCYRGVPQREIGVRTDVLDGCPKAQGMMMLLRAMSPQVIATDEIGRQEDVSALEEVFNAGVKVLTTVHGSSLDEVSARPVLQKIFKNRLVERYILLSRSNGVGTIEDVIDGRTMCSLGVRLC